MRKNYPKNMRINAEFLEFRAKHTPNLKIFLYLCTSFDKNKTINMAKKVLFINQEIDPYVAESYMSTMGRELPQKMQEAGFEIRTFMPKWGTINERRGQLHEVIRLSGMNLIIDDTDHPLIIKVASIPTTRQQIYFIDNDDYFNNRQMGADENGVEYTDNGERAIFFARGVLETVKKLRWQPDVIICPHGRRQPACSGHHTPRGQSNHGHGNTRRWRLRQTEHSTAWRQGLLRWHSR